MSNPDNVREFMEQWARQERDVEEGLREGGEGEGGDDYSDNLEIVISDDKDKNDNDDEDDDEDEDEE